MEPDPASSEPAQGARARPPAAVQIAWQWSRYPRCTPSRGAHLAPGSPHGGNGAALNGKEHRRRSRSTRQVGLVLAPGWSRCRRRRPSGQAVIGEVDMPIGQPRDPVGDAQLPPALRSALSPARPREACGPRNLLCREMHRAAAAGAAEVPVIRPRFGVTDPARDRLAVDRAMNLKGFASANIVVRTTSRRTGVVPSVAFCLEEEGLGQCDVALDTRSAELTTVTAAVRVIPKRSGYTPGAATSCRDTSGTPLTGPAAFRGGRLKYARLSSSEVAGAPARAAVA